MAPQPPLKTMYSPSDYGFSRQYLWLDCQDHQTPPLPREHRDQSSIVTIISSSPELCDQSSIFTRASSPPELRDQSSIFSGVPPFTRTLSSPELHNQR